MTACSSRNLYLTNTPVEEAKSRFFGLFPDIGKHTESVSVKDSLGRITVEPVIAECNSPLYDSAAMDGIAVVSGKTRGASENSPIMLEIGAGYVIVDTGDPVRPPFDAVIPAEDIEEKPGGSVLIRQAASVWQHVRPIGEDIVRSEMILPSFHKIRPFDIGVLLSGGITKIEVFRKPKVAIIPTGSELVEAGAPHKEGAIIESNSYMLSAKVVEDGGVPTRCSIVRDKYDDIKNALEGALIDHDIVLLLSGTSAGTEDFAIHVLKDLGHVEVHGVAIKPGKPVILAQVFGKPVIGVPGYPVSCYLAYENFVKPLLVNREAKNIVRATLTRRLVSSFKHKEYVRVKIGRIGEKLICTPLARGAGAAMSLVRADGFCVIEQNIEGLDAGTEADVVLIRSLEDLERTVVSIGSHDLVLDIIADMLGRGSAARLSSSHTGSMGGLMALKNNETHIAPIHHLEAETGTYNIPIVKKMLAKKMALIKGVGRVQGLMVKKGNPMGIRSLEDLTRCRFVNRQRGAGTRILFDYKLKQANIAASDVNGYDREAATHMAVAAAVAGEGADCGLGVLSAAKAMGLDFVPIDKEEYDFALPQEFLNLEHVQAFLNVLKNSELHDKLTELGGYDITRCGEVVFI